MTILKLKNRDNTFDIVFNSCVFFSGAILILLVVIFLYQIILVCKLQFPLGWISDTLKAAEGSLIQKFSF